MRFGPNRLEILSEFGDGLRTSSPSVKASLAHPKAQLCHSHLNSSHALNIFLRVFGTLGYDVDRIVVHSFN